MCKDVYSSFMSTIEVYYIIFYTSNAILRNGSSHIIFPFLCRRREPDSLAIARAQFKKRRCIHRTIIYLICYYILSLLQNRCDGVIHQ